MLRATEGASTLEGTRPPAPPVPERPQRVVLTEHPDWQPPPATKAPKEDLPQAKAQPKSGKPPTHSGPIQPLKQEPGLEPGLAQREAGEKLGRRDTPPRRGLEASSKDLSPWDGTTNWG
eukprot:330043-Amphidinium_carterae.1